MAPKDKIFTHEAECLLIQLVQQCPMLWDAICKEYRRNDLKCGQWHRIAETLSPQLTGDIVKKRFENMASTFRDNNRRVRESVNRCSGKGTDEMYKPKWEFFEMLSFLKKTCVQSESIDNFSSASTSSCDSLSVQLDSQSQQDRPLSLYFDDNTKMFTMFPLDNSNLLSPSTSTTPFSELNSLNSTQLNGEESQQSSEVANKSSDVGCVAQNTVTVPLAAFRPPPRPSSAPSGFKRPNDDPLYVKRGSSKKSSVDEAVEAIKNLAKQEPPPPPQLDHFEVFGSYIASRLRNMSSDDQQYYERELLRVLAQPRQL